MRAIRVSVLTCTYIAVIVSVAASSGGPCDEIENENWGGSFGTLKVCFMESTAIDSTDFLITSDQDENVGAFFSTNNKNLEYLPNNLGAKFPNLVALSAGYCFIKEVTKENLKGISKLRELYLPGNQIEKIDDDTFEHIPAVEIIRLSVNKIKKLNGRAFASLHKLTEVWLTRNECINENFYGPTRIAEMYRVVNEKCEFLDNAPFVTKIAKLGADLTLQSEELQALKMDIAKIKTEKTQAEITAQYNEIKAQLKEVCDARIELQEYSNLSNDLQAKTAEINEKNEKIRQLERKIQDFGM